MNDSGDHLMNDSGDAGYAGNAGDVLVMLGGFKSTGNDATVLT